MTKHDRMIIRIISHGKNLYRIFNIDPAYDPLVLCKKLRRLELKGSKISEDYCNGFIEMEKWEVEKDKILIEVDKLINYTLFDIPVIFNSDPRGYCLKIDDNFIRKNNIKIHTDMGGYGILAPDLTDD